jgi:phage gp29-like protein
MEVKQEKIEVDAKSLMGVINDQLMRWLMLFNAGPGVEPPKWIIEYKPAEDLERRAKRDQILVDMGVPFPVSHAQFVYQIPEPEGAEPLLAPIKTAAPTPPAQSAIPQFQESGIPPDLADGIQDVERLVAGSVEAAARAVYAPLLKQILDEAEAAIQKKKPSRSPL